MTAKKYRNKGMIKLTSEVCTQDWKQTFNQNQELIWRSTYLIWDFWAFSFRPPLESHQFKSYSSSSGIKYLSKIEPLQKQKDCEMRMWELPTWTVFWGLSVSCITRQWLFISSQAPLLSVNRQRWLQIIRHKFSVSKATGKGQTHRELEENK